MIKNSPNSTIESPEKSPTTVGAKVRNLLIVLATIVLSVAFVLGLRTETSTATLTTLAENSLPLEIAMTNGKPTLVEFYANWCTTCQAMASDMNELEEQYTNKVNFVMLNVDNNKWLPEIERYRVDGIPHFVFFEKEGNAIAQTIGEQPKTIMAANLEALVAGESLPYAKTTGQVSKFTPSVTTNKANSDDPRLHGSQVKN
ncbi:thiol:disulfide interchange protein [[Phormidium ambiguum] IAM M-71]|uniref:Thiol:disulfide interchange protein n=1 Tax=[Phormidium ambiguum] IAM M-71 TaxID=454136 RepID=A0A1U7IK39_9CYAN|nr:thioredoxin family protein [Phormidium ambiguum]OKH37580.1 thiol:disulfide interchange protein [Phormidium ambiguum IAM M-71]